MLFATKTRFAKLGPLGRCVAVALTLAVTALVVLPLAALQQGSAGVIAALMAMLTILMGGCGAAALSEWLAKPGDALSGLLFGMLGRMVFPLVVCLIGALNPGPLLDNGFLIYTVIFYAVALAAETTLDVLRIGATSPTT